MQDAITQRHVQYEHEQVKISIGDDEFLVDKGIEDLILSFNEWGFATANSCIDNHGMVWISFFDIDGVRDFIQLSLVKRNKINGQGFVRETLFDYLTDGMCNWKCDFYERSIIDPRDNESIIDIGVVRENISLRFPKEDLDKFKRLFFEVLD